MTHESKQTIGRYEVIRSIGRGSQATVYQGRDPTLDRLVAIKVLTGHDAALNRMTDDGAPVEARISSKLKHPNIVPIFDAGECATGPYLVFEYVEGQTLAQLLESDGAMPLDKALPIIAAILKALDAAHASEILHLDLNPRNILIDRDDMPRVMDFGLAQYIDLARERDEYATGTLRYMAPEHFLGDPLGPWTDVFALGSTFFEVLTNERAMRGESLEQIQYRILCGDVDFAPLQDLEHGAALTRFLAGALEKKREGRYADCGVMSEAFELFLKEAGLSDVVEAAGSNHSTIEFLLRRMQRTGDFPTISRTLSDINRLTGDSADANADKLANVILRDFALTQKLLKLVNSAFYGARSSEISSISQAVVFLGVEKVRMTANSLTFFGAMKGDSAVLKDSMIKAFLSGLIARHLAQRARLPEAEEAFISGMCQNLGENLVIFYFPEEFDHICELQQNEGLDKFAAARGALGVSYAELGAAVAKTWNLPAAIVDAIRGLPPGPVAAPGSDAEALRNCAVFANELCDVFHYAEPEKTTAAIGDLIDRYSASLELPAEYILPLMSAAYEKLKQYAPIFEINVAASDYCKAVQGWAVVETQKAEAAANDSNAEERSEGLPAAG